MICQGPSVSGDVSLRSTTLTVAYDETSDKEEMGFRPLAPEKDVRRMPSGVLCST